MGYVFSNTELMFGKTPAAQRDALGLGACATMDDCGGGGGSFDPAASYENLTGNWAWVGGSSSQRQIRVERVANASNSTYPRIAVGNNSGNNSGRPSAGDFIGAYEFRNNRRSDNDMVTGAYFIAQATENWAESALGPHGTRIGVVNIPQGSADLAQTLWFEENGVIDYLGNDATPPGNTTTPATWITIKKDGVAYKVPGYQ